MSNEKLQINPEERRMEYLDRLNLITKTIKQLSVNNAGVTVIGPLRIYYEPFTFSLRLKHSDGSYIGLEEERIEANSMDVKTRIKLYHKTNNHETVYRCSNDKALKKYINGNEPIISSMSEDDFDKASELLNIISGAIYKGRPTAA